MSPKLVSRMFYIPHFTLVCIVTGGEHSGQMIGMMIAMFVNYLQWITKDTWPTLALSFTLGLGWLVTLNLKFRFNGIFSKLPFPRDRNRNPVWKIFLQCSVDHSQIIPTCYYRNKVGSGEQAYPITSLHFYFM